MPFPSCRQYPKDIKVKGMTWDIKFCRRTPDQPPTDLGLCDPEERTIYIRYRQKPRDTFITFAHEIIHAIEFEYEVEIGHNIIEKLEEPIADLFMENPEFFIEFVFQMFVDEGE